MIKLNHFIFYVIKLYTLRKEPEFTGDQRDWSPEEHLRSCVGGVEVLPSGKAEHSS